MTRPPSIRPAWQKWLFYLMGIGTIGASPVLLFEDTIRNFMVGAPESADLFLAPALDSITVQEHAKDTILSLAPMTDEEWEERWDSTFRISEMDGQRSTKQQFREYNEPKGRRIGCICMDEIIQDEKGRGACSGRGGVRYWLYLQESDSIYKMATARHYAHPEPLEEEDIENLSRHNRKKNEMNNYNLLYGFYQMIIVMTVCATLLLMIRDLSSPKL